MLIFEARLPRSKRGDNGPGDRETRQNRKRNDSHLYYCVLLIKICWNIHAPKCCLKLAVCLAVLFILQTNKFAKCRPSVVGVIFAPSSQLDTGHATVLTRVHALQPAAKRQLDARRRHTVDSDIAHARHTLLIVVIHLDDHNACPGEFHGGAECTRHIYTRVMPKIDDSLCSLTVHKVLLRNYNKCARQNARVLECVTDTTMWSI